LPQGDEARVNRVASSAQTDRSEHERGDDADGTGEIPS
jgi:hypothetical protein